MARTFVPVHEAEVRCDLRKGTGPREALYPGADNWREFQFGDELRGRFAPARAFEDPELLILGTPGSGKTVHLLTLGFEWISMRRLSRLGFSRSGEAYYASACQLLEDSMLTAFEHKSPTPCLWLLDDVSVDERAAEIARASLVAYRHFGLSSRGHRLVMAGWAVPSGVQDVVRVRKAVTRGLIENALRLSGHSCDPAVLEPLAQLSPSLRDVLRVAHSNPKLLMNPKEVVAGRILEARRLLTSNEYQELVHLSVLRFLGVYYPSLDPVRARLQMNVAQKGGWAFWIRGQRLWCVSDDVARGVLQLEMQKEVEPVDAFSRQVLDYLESYRAADPNLAVEVLIALSRRTEADLEAWTSRTAVDDRESQTLLASSLGSGLESFSHRNLPRLVELATPSQRAELPGAFATGRSGSSVSKAAVLEMCWSHLFQSVKSGEPLSWLASVRLATTLEEVGEPEAGLSRARMLKQLQKFARTAEAEATLRSFDPMIRGQILWKLLVAEGVDEGDAWADLEGLWTQELALKSPRALAKALLEPRGASISVRSKMIEAAPTQTLRAILLSRPRQGVEIVRRFQRTDAVARLRQDIQSRPPTAEEAQNLRKPFDVANLIEAAVVLNAPTIVSTSEVLNRLGDVVRLTKQGQSIVLIANHLRSTSPSFQGARNRVIDALADSIAQGQRPLGNRLHALQILDWRRALRAEIGIPSEDWISLPGAAQELFWFLLACFVPGAPVRRAVGLAAQAAVELLRADSEDRNWGLRVPLAGVLAAMNQDPPPALTRPVPSFSESGVPSAATLTIVSVLYLSVKQDQLEFYGKERLEWLVRGLAVPSAELLRSWARLPPQRRRILVELMGRSLMGLSEIDVHLASYWLESVSGEVGDALWESAPLQRLLVVHRLASRGQFESLLRRRAGEWRRRFASLSTPEVLARSISNRMGIGFADDELTDLLASVTSSARG